MFFFFYALPFHSPFPVVFSHYLWTQLHFSVVCVVLYPHRIFQEPTYEIQVVDLWSLVRMPRQVAEWA